MRNGKRLLSLLLAVTMLATCIVFSSAPVFAAYNDTLGHWAASSIDELTQQGIVSGDGDGSFRPDASITRAEFLKMVCGVSGQKTAADVNFTDVDENAWYMPTLKIAAAAGYVQGYEDGTVRPNANISREEAATIIYRAFTSSLLGATGEITFEDADDIADYAKAAVAALVAKNVINGYEGNVFLPKNEITRAESAKMLVSFIGNGIRTGNTSTSFSNGTGTGAGTGGNVYISGGGSYNGGSKGGSAVKFKDLPKNNTITVEVGETYELFDMGVNPGNATIVITTFPDERYRRG